MLPPKPQTSDEAKEAVSLLAKAITAEPPVACMFVHWNMLEYKLSLLDRLPGLVLGAAIGGPGGEMLFGGTLLSKGSGRYFGPLGLLVVTRDRLIIGHLDAPFASLDGSISPDHLQLFRARLLLNNVARKEFTIGTTKMMESPTLPSTMDLVCGDETLSISQSQLLLNDTRIDLPNLTEIQKLVVKFGSLPTTDQFIARLAAGENPVSETQCLQLQADPTYLSTLLPQLIKHDKRDVLIHNFSLMPVSLAGELRARLQTAAATAAKKLASPLAGYATACGILLTAAAGLGVGLYGFRNVRQSGEVQSDWVSLVILGGCLLLSVAVSWFIFCTWRDSRRYSRHVAHCARLLAAQADLDAVSHH